MRLHGEQRTYNEVKVNATLKPMNAKWAIIRVVEEKTLNWQSYLLPATTLTYLLQSFTMPYRALHCHRQSLNDSSSLWWLWTYLQPGASPGLQERWLSDPKAQWSEGCTWRCSISGLQGSNKGARVRTWWKEKPPGPSGWSESEISVWQPQTKALFDIRVIATDAQSHAQRSVDAVLLSAS